MRQLSIFLLLAAISVCTFTLTADEGMYPLSMIHKVNLKEKGLKIDVNEIYNPEGVSLVDAICEVGGGTGEFVSEDGLILTNHHIAFSGVTAASTTEHDYLKDGFTARTRAEEIPAEGYVCNITEDYEDVSDEILDGISLDTPPIERNGLIRQRMVSMARARENGRKNIHCEVSEMYPGKSYVLFTYRTIRDVRLVYVPPLAIGEYGGEFDNWVWPRHTGDFSFLRAYVAPDGSTAEYSKDNVPYKPKKHLTLNPKGVDEGDFVMILGYPGRTYRHKTSHYVAMHQKNYLPFIAEHFDWLIDRMEEAGKGNREIQLKYAGDIKSYANVTKNFKGKLQGLRRLGLVEKKHSEEAELQQFIDANSDLKARYGSVLADIKKTYEVLSSSVRQEMAARFMIRTSSAIQLAYAANNVLHLAPSETEKRKGAINTMKEIKAEMLLPVEKDIVAHWLATAVQLPDDESIAPIKALLSSNGKDVEAEAAAWTEKAFATSILLQKGGIDKFASMSKDEVLALNDPLIAFAGELQKSVRSTGTRSEERNGTLNKLEAELLDAKMQWKESDFIPDANSTLRLTYGYIRGYNPSDATYYSPITSLRGVVEKDQGKEPYNAPQKLLDLYASKNYDPSFKSSALDDVPVAILYNMDTTGGNSGSPILDAYGRLIGVNFDRAYEATINDYEWSESYSRSIGVDIRYVLFVAKYVGGADFLLKELNVEG